MPDFSHCAPSISDMTSLGSTIALLGLGLILPFLLLFVRQQLLLFRMFLLHLLRLPLMLLLN